MPQVRPGSRDNALCSILLLLTAPAFCKLRGNSTLLSDFWPKACFSRLRKVLARKAITILENHDDYQSGFEVQSPEPRFFSWDATYEEVIASLLVERVKCNDYGENRFSHEYAFRYPVRVGNLLFQPFLFSLTTVQRTDIAVREYSARSEKGACMSDFWKIHHRLEQDMPLQSSDACDKNLYSAFMKDDISFRMTYHGEPRFRDICFVICNTRDCLGAIKPHENEGSMQITDCLLFPENDILIEGDYRTFIHVKRRPPSLTEKFGGKAVLWKDAANNEIGVSAGGVCNIFPLSGIEKVDVDRMLPAKGHGADYLRVHYKDRKYPACILETSDHYLDKHFETLERFFGLPVEITGFYYNC